MGCQNVCKLCKNLVISTAVNYDAAANQVIIALPARTFYNCEKYCIVVAQSIPTSATLSSAVVITIGDGATRYALVKNNCQPATACNIKSRTKYAVCVATNASSGVFRLLGNVGCSGAEVLESLPIVEPAVTTANIVEEGTVNG